MLHSFNAWLKRLKSKPLGTRRKKPGSIIRSKRLLLEQLEDRLTPSGAASLGTYSLLEGPAAGSDSDIVAVSGAWTATANVSWLRTASSGSGNGLATFTFDANSGATRTGTLTIGGDTLTVTQAGSSYAAAANPVTIVSSGLSLPSGVAVDSSGNVYIADSLGKAITEWNASTQMVTTLVSSGLDQPQGVAVDGAGNVYIADTNDNAIKEWNASTQTVTTLVSSGLDQPQGVAVDGAGNVYIADTNDNAIKEWNASTQTVTTLVSSGLSFPSGVAVDGAGNVYIADTGNQAIKEWNASTHMVTPLVSSGLSGPNGLAVDGSGNVYIADSGNNMIEEWNASTQTVTPLISAGLNHPTGVAVDGAGNVYLTQAFTFMPVLLPGLPNSDNNYNLPGLPNSDNNYNAIRELSRAFVPVGAVNEPAAAGADALLPVLPTTESLTSVFTPRSNQSWLTIGAIANGVVNFSFTQNTGAARTADLSVLGQQIAVTQAPALGADALVEGPAAGSDSDIVAVSGSWSATANVSWLHTASSGSGNGLATFTFDANTGATRTGTLTIAGETLTVTQAGSSYVSASPLTQLAILQGFPSSNFGPVTVAVDGAGNVYFSVSADNAIDEWNAATQTISTVVSSGLNEPYGVAVDGAGNVFIADFGDNAIKEWHAATQTLSTLVSSGLSGPYGVAVDGSGNVYIADSGNSAVKEWNASTQTVTILVSSGLSSPTGVAVDSAGNVYIADFGNNAIKEWNATTQTVSTLVSSGLSGPYGVAVDGSGNVYIADSGNNAVKEWNATTQTVTTLASSDDPEGVAVDGSGNVYIGYIASIASIGSAPSNGGVTNDIFFVNDLFVMVNTLEELPRAFVPAGAFSEGAAAGSDALLPVLPATESLTGVFAPTSNQSWLTVGTTANGVVNFSFSQNVGPARTADLTVLGQQIAVTQQTGLLSADQQFVQALYVHDLGRAGMISELNGWVAVLHGPGGQAAVAAGIARSPEALDHLVQGWYQTYLGRQAQGGEELGWVNLLQAGQSEEQVLSDILGGVEFFNRAQTMGFGGTADQNYVLALYQLLLGRSASSNELAGWVGALPGFGRSGVAEQFLQGQEYRTDTISGYYSTLMHAPVDLQGLNFWVSSGLDLLSIQIGFESSPEFYDSNSQTLPIPPSPMASPILYFTPITTPPIGILAAT